MSSKNIEIKRQDSKAVKKALKALASVEVLVGIPDDSPARSDGSPLTNAQIAYIHEFGSEVAGIPARPFLHPGVKEAEKAVLNCFKSAVKAGMKGDEETMTKYLNRAGLVASSSVKDAIVHGDFEPLKPASIRNRKRGRLTQSRRDNESYETGEFGQGIKPLINSAQMLQSITYVVK